MKKVMVTFGYAKWCFNTQQEAFEFLMAINEAESVDDKLIEKEFYAVPDKKHWSVREIEYLTPEEYEAKRLEAL